LLIWPPLSPRHYTLHYNYDFYLGFPSPILSGCYSSSSEQLQNKNALNRDCTVRRGLQKDCQSSRCTVSQKRPTYMRHVYAARSRVCDFKKVTAFNILTRQSAPRNSNSSIHTVTLDSDVITVARNCGRLLCFGRVIFMLFICFPSTHFSTSLGRLSRTFITKSGYVVK